ncbi:MAG TPA: PilC/PilY family type IV pilus protein, partial [Polyangiaceae bacterium]|nr:PilC/PilY family type IV pilus protein [Polyangiaceae bacterium]
MSSLRHLAIPTILLGLSSVGAEAFAQSVDPGTGSVKQKPNVMLLVDSSGSMEHIAGSSTTYPTCGGASDGKSRWINVIEVLAGNITNYSCDRIDRTDSNFSSRFELPGGVAPVDVDYRNPYIRPLSNNCGPAPKLSATPPTDAFGWIAPDFKDRYSAGFNLCSSSSFQQDGASGLINALGSVVRFGLMTFDTLPNRERGYSGIVTDYPNGVKGAFSYYLNSDYATGRPADCSTYQDVEVGVRNAAAPAWEGRMVAFGNPKASDADNNDRHDRIKRVLLATRPYGATPIAGALSDAQTFFWDDQDKDPLDPTGTQYFSPEGGSDTEGDLYVKNECRDQYIILLTDGEPNLDLREDCSRTPTNPSLPGKCPFDTPEVIADELAKGMGGKKVKTYVVGFAADVYNVGAGNVDCKADNFDMSVCSNKPLLDTNNALKVCCKLHSIAIAGGTEKAYFASDATTLQTELAAVLSDIVKTGTASATQPVLSPRVSTPSRAGGAVAFRLLTSYTIGDSTRLWRGNIERQRFLCKNGLPEPQNMSATEGDDISSNVTTARSTRTIMSFLPEEASAGIMHPQRSVRPNVATDVADGLATYGRAGAQISGTPSSFVSAVTSSAMEANLTQGGCNGMANADACRTAMLNWSLGITTTGETRCSGSGDPNCSVIADIMHSTPTIVDRPSSLPSNASYQAFMTANTKRAMMAYTSSNDGYLHALQLAANHADDSAYTDKAANNERYAFIPPAIFPSLQTQYPNKPSKLLDGPPIVLDVPAEKGGFNDDYYPYKLQRQGKVVLGEVTDASSMWRTVLVQAFGGSRGGYFAVDITDPKIPSSWDKNAGPRLLWQLTTDAAGNPLFGEGGGTPLITSIYDSATKTEIAVAVLPGGYGGAPMSGACPRKTSTTVAQLDTNSQPLNRVHCYPFDQANDGAKAAQSDQVSLAGARSLTIVRLDNGEILRSFRRGDDDTMGIDATRRTAADLDSPITGVPSAYPFGVGAVADRVFIGDQDGTLWRVDLSGSPADWKMELFFDTFIEHSSKSSPTTVVAQRRAIVTRPMLSVDERGQLSIAVATGDQSVSGATTDEQFVWSLLERRNPASATTRYSTL